jgi:hypothetical protein
MQLPQRFPAIGFAQDTFLSTGCVAHAGDETKPVYHKLEFRSISVNSALLHKLQQLTAVGAASIAFSTVGWLIQLL